MNNDNQLIEEIRTWDAVIGNPPYQNGNQEGGQNKIYNQFSKIALQIADMVAFITPSSVLKESKRFSLIGVDGLKYVNFTANDYFDVGVKICYWIVQKGYNGDVTVQYKTKQSVVQKNDLIFNMEEIDEDFIHLYKKLKGIANTPYKRMFAQNAFGPAMKKEQDGIYKYKLKRISKNKKEISFYSSKTPYYFNKLKFIVSITKSMNNAIIIDKDDYDLNYLCIEIKNKYEADNIKSFILSEYFTEHIKKWKKVDGYGFNCALKYLPPFDKTRKWTNEDVKNFIDN